MAVALGIIALVDLVLCLVCRLGLIAWLWGAPIQDEVLAWVSAASGGVLPVPKGGVRIYPILYLWRGPTVVVDLLDVDLDTETMDYINFPCWYLPGVVRSASMPVLRLSLSLNLLARGAVTLHAPAGATVICDPTLPPDWDAAEVATYLLSWKRWRVDRIAYLLDLRAGRRWRRWQEGFVGGLASAAVHRFLRLVEIRITRFAWIYGDGSSVPEGDEPAASFPVGLEYRVDELTLRSAPLRARSFAWALPARAMLWGEGSRLSVVDRSRPQGASDRSLVLLSSAAFELDLGLAGATFLKLRPVAPVVYVDVRRVQLLRQARALYRAYGDWYARVVERTEAAWLARATEAMEAEHAAAFANLARRPGALARVEDALTGDEALRCRWILRGAAWARARGRGEVTGDSDAARAALGARLLAQARRVQTLELCLQPDGVVRCLVEAPVSSPALCLALEGIAFSTWAAIGARVDGADWLHVKMALTSLRLTDISGSHSPARTVALAGAVDGHGEAALDLRLESGGGGGGWRGRLEAGRVSINTLPTPGVALALKSFGEDMSGPGAGAGGGDALSLSVAECVASAAQDIHLAARGASDPGPPTWDPDEATRAEAAGDEWERLAAEEAARTFCAAITSAGASNLSARAAGASSEPQLPWVPAVSAAAALPCSGGHAVDMSVAVVALDLIAGARLDRDEAIGRALMTRVVARASARGDGSEEHATAVVGMLAVIEHLATLEEAHAADLVANRVGEFVMEPVDVCMDLRGRIAARESSFEAPAEAADEGQSPSPPGPREDVRLEVTAPGQMSFLLTRESVDLLLCTLRTARAAGTWAGGEAAAALARTASGDRDGPLRVATHGVGGSGGGGGGDGGDGSDLGSSATSAAGRQPLRFGRVQQEGRIQDQWQRRAQALTALARSVSNGNALAQAPAAAAGAGYRRLVATARVALAGVRVCISEERWEVPMVQAAVGLVEGCLRVARQGGGGPAVVGWLPLVAADAATGDLGLRLTAEYGNSRLGVLEPFVEPWVLHLHARKPQGSAQVTLGISADGLAALNVSPLTTTAVVSAASLVADGVNSSASVVSALATPSRAATALTGETAAPAASGAGPSAVASSFSPQGSLFGPGDQMLLSPRRLTRGLPGSGNYARWRGVLDGGATGADSGEDEGAPAGGAAAAPQNPPDPVSSSLFAVKNALDIPLTVLWREAEADGADAGEDEQGGDALAHAPAATTYGAWDRVRVGPGETRRFGKPPAALEGSTASGATRRSPRGLGANVWAVQTCIEVEGFQEIGGVSLREIGGHARLLWPRVARPGARPSLAVVLEVCRLPAGQRLLCIRAPISARNGTEQALRLASQKGDWVVGLHAGARTPLPHAALDEEALQLSAVQPGVDGGVWRAVAGALAASPSRLSQSSAPHAAPELAEANLAEAVARLTSPPGQPSATRGARAVVVRPPAAPGADRGGGGGGGGRDLREDGSGVSAALTIVAKPRPLLSGAASGVLDLDVSVASAYNLANRLPIALEIDLAAEATDAFGEVTAFRGTVAAGATSELAMVFPMTTRVVAIRVRPVGSGTHGWSSLSRLVLTGDKSTMLGGGSAWLLSFMDGGVHVVVTLEPPSPSTDAVAIVISAPVWVQNMTGLPLEYQLVQSGTRGGVVARAGGTPTTTDLVNRHWLKGVDWPGAGPELGAGPGDSAFGAQPLSAALVADDRLWERGGGGGGLLLRVRVSGAGAGGGHLSGIGDVASAAVARSVPFGSSWSLPFAVHTFGADGEVVLELADGSCGFLGVSVRPPPPGFESYASLVTICPRYTVVNGLPKPVFVLPEVFAPTALDDAGPQRGGDLAMDHTVQHVLVAAGGAMPIFTFPPAGTAPCALRIRVLGSSAAPRPVGEPVGPSTAPSAAGGDAGFPAQPAGGREGWALSPLLPLDTLEDMYFRLSRAGALTNHSIGSGSRPLPVSEEDWTAPIVRCALVQRNASIAVTLADASSSPPFIVENRTSVPLTISHAGGQDRARTLQPLHWCAYAWPSPRCERRLRVAAAGGSRHRVPAEFALEYLGHFPPCPLPGGAHGDKLYARVHARGPTRVLALADRPASEDTVSTAEAPLTLAVSMGGFAATVLDAVPRELLYITCMGIHGTLALAPKLQRLELKVRCVQIDDLREAPRHPVLLSLAERSTRAQPSGPGSRLGPEAGEGSGAVSPSESPDACFFYAQMARRDPSFYHLVQIVPPSLLLNLDVAVVVAALRGVFGAADDETSSTAGATAIGSLVEAVTGVAAAAAAADAVREALAAEVADASPPTPAEVAALASGPSARRAIYCQALHIGPMATRVTAVVQMPPRGSAGSGSRHTGPEKAGAEGIAGALNATRRLPLPSFVRHGLRWLLRTLSGVLGTLGASLANVSDLNFRFSEVMLTNAFSDERQLWSRLSVLYGRQAVTQLGASAYSHAMASRGGEPAATLTCLDRPTSQRRPPGAVARQGAGLCGRAGQPSRPRGRRGHGCDHLCPGRCRRHRRRRRPARRRGRQGPRTRRDWRGHGEHRQAYGKP